MHGNNNEYDSKHGNELVLRIGNELLMKNYNKLKPEEAESLKNIKDSNKFLQKVIEKILSGDSFNLLKHLSVIEDKIDCEAAIETYESIFENAEKLFDELISTHILERIHSKIFFSFNQIKEILRDDKENYHHLAKLYYIKKMEKYGKNQRDLIESVFHSLKSGDVGYSVETFVELSNRAIEAEKLTEIGEKLLEVIDSEARGKVLGLLGNLCFNKKPEKAEKYYIEAIEVYMGLSHENQELYMPELAKVFNNLGNLYCTLRRFKEAEEHYKWAARIFSKLNLPELAISLDNLGILYTDLRRFNEAEEILKESLEIRKRLKTSFDLAMTLNNLGIVYRNIGKIEEVEKCYKEILSIFRKLAEENEEYLPYLAGVLNNLGALYVETDRVAEGLKLVEEAFGYDIPPELKAKCYLTAGKGFEKMGDERAAEYYLKAASISFTLFRQGIQSLNFIHWLEKVEKLASGKLRGDAILMKSAIFRVYYRFKVDIPEIECSKRGELIIKALKGESIDDFRISSEEDMAVYILARDLKSL
jgi:tetratricopeptide (TPR) repeat protein